MSANKIISDDAIESLMTSAGYPTHMPAFFIGRNFRFDYVESAGDEKAADHYEALVSVYGTISGVVVTQDADRSSEPLLKLHFGAPKTGYVETINHITFSDHVGWTVQLEWGDTLGDVKGVLTLL